MRDERLRIMLEVGLAVALAAVLGRIRLFQMPMGGSVSLGMLPILIVALRRGLVPGLVAGTLYGLVDLMFDPFVIGPVQFLLDYPLAWGAVGLAGLAAGLRRRALAGSGAAWGAVLPGVVIGSAGRMAMHWLSGLVFFSEYAGGQAPWLYSLAYNGSYLLPSAVICAVAAVAVLPLLERAVPSDRAA